MVQNYHLADTSVLCHQVHQCNSSWLQEQKPYLYSYWTNSESKRCKQRVFLSCFMVAISCSRCSWHQVIWNGVSKGFVTCNIRQSRGPFPIGHNTWCISVSWCSFFSDKPPNYIRSWNKTPLANAAGNVATWRPDKNILFQRSEILEFRTFFVQNLLCMVACFLMRKPKQTLIISNWVQLLCSTRPQPRCNITWPPAQRSLSAAADSIAVEQKTPVTTFTLGFRRVHLWCMGIAGCLPAFLSAKGLLMVFDFLGIYLTAALVVTAGATEPTKYATRKMDGKQSAYPLMQTL